MIASLGFRFITSSWGRYIVIALAVLAALAAWGRSRSREGAERARTRIVEDVRSRTERGRDAFHQNQRQVDGVDSGAVAERLRGRDDHWGRMPDLR